MILSFSKPPSELAGKRIVLFSYGSGLASSMYSLKLSSDATPSSPLVTLMSKVQDVPDRLRSRKVVVPGDFESMMKIREDTHHMAPYVPVGDITSLFPGTYYLEKVDDKHRRTYLRASSTTPTGTQQKLLPPVRLNVANGQ